MINNYAKNGGPGEVAWLLWNSKPWAFVIVWSDYKNGLTAWRYESEICYEGSWKARLRCRELTEEYQLHNVTNTEIRAVKDHGKNYLDFWLFLVYHLLRNHLLKILPKDSEAYILIDVV